MLVEKNRDSQIFWGDTVGYYFGLHKFPRGALGTDIAGKFSYATCFTFTTASAAGGSVGNLSWQYRWQLDATNARSFLKPSKLR